MKSKVIFILLAVMAFFSGTSFAKKIYQYRDYSFIEHHAPHHPQTMGSRMIHVVLDYSHLLTLNDQSVRYGNPDDLYRQYFAFYQKALLQDFGVELKSRDQHNIQRSVIAYRLLRQVDKLMGQAPVNHQFHNISHQAGVKAADQWILNEAFKKVQQEFNYFLNHKAIQQEAIQQVAPKKVYKPIFINIPGKPLRAVQGNEHPRAIEAKFGPNNLTQSGSRFGSDHRTHDGQQYYNGYDYQGYNAQGFNASNIHRDTQTEFGPNNLTQSGSRFGSNNRTYDGQQYYNGYDYQGYNAQGYNAQGQNQSEAQELLIGKACYIPGANDYIGRENQRDLKNFPTAPVTEDVETIDLTQFNNKDEFITGIHNKCKEYNSPVRANVGESIIQTRNRLFNSLRTDLIDIVHAGVNPFRDEEFFLRNIKREDMVAEYLNVIKPDHLNKKTSVSFVGESGIDAGGLRKELFRKIIDKLQQEGVFSKVSGESSAWELNPDFTNYNFCTRPDQTRDKQTCFENIGKIIAKIIMVEKDYVEIPLSNYLLQRILDNRPSSLVDFFSLAKLDDSKELFKNQIETLKYDDPSFFTFVFAFHNGADYDDYITDGQNVEVTSDNIYLFTLLDLKYKIATRRSDVTQHFLTGFHSVINPFALQVSGVNANELELILRGIPEIKVNDVQPLVRTSGNATQIEKDQIVRWFWEIAREVEAEDANFMPQVMAFWTSSKTIPTDIDSNPMKFSVQSDRSTERLPTSHTCFNTLELSVYPSKQAMKVKLEQAVRLSQGFED